MMKDTERFGDCASSQNEEAREKGEQDYLRREKEIDRCRPAAAPNRLGLIRVVTLPLCGSARNC